MVKFRVVELFLLSILSDIAYRVNCLTAKNGSYRLHMALKETIYKLTVFIATAQGDGLEPPHGERCANITGYIAEIALT